MAAGPEFKLFASNKFQSVIEREVANSERGDPQDLCEKCRPIFTKASTFEDLTSWSGIQYRRRRSSMLASAIQGCVLCRRLLRLPFDIDPQRRSELQREARRNKQSVSPLSLRLEYWKSALEKLEARPSSSYSELIRKFHDPEYRFTLRGDISINYYIQVTVNEPFHSKQKQKLGITTRDEDPTSGVVLGRTINPNVLDEATYVKVRKWLKDCTSNHTSCSDKTPEEVRRPGLVLDVLPMPSEPGMVQLRRGTATDSSMFEYAALSYCWGQDTTQSNSTTRYNLDEYLQGISTDRLPQSIQDAITVTRKLHLQYLWVDSLCIIQDSEENKIHEMGRMDSIYGNAIVTISARKMPVCVSQGVRYLELRQNRFTSAVKFSAFLPLILDYYSSAEDCHSGFLGTREVPKEFIKIPFCAANGQLGQVSLSYWHEWDKYSTSPKKWWSPKIWTSEYSIPVEPIDSRAWTFQESFMSPRLLLYSKYQLFWLCSEHWDKDGGRLTREDYFRGHRDMELSSRTLKKPTTLDWISVIREYSSRKLSKPSDKLCALSSIAGYFAKQLNDQYLAGLWASDLLYQLCWTGGDTRPPFWRCPSWSFMSMEGKILFEPRTNLDFIVTKSDLGRKALSSILKPYLGCIVMNYGIQPLSDEAPYGEVKSGFIKVCGRLLQTRITKPIDLDFNSHANFGHGIPLRVTSPNGRATNKGILRFDASKGDSTAPICTTQGVMDKKASLWCLLMCLEGQKSPGEQFRDPVSGTLDYDKYLPWGLTLARLPDGNYHRVGYFKGLYELVKDFRNQPTEEIVIV